MDSRGIPIVFSAKRLNTAPKRTQQSTTPKRYDGPPSPFFVPSIKNELTLLEAYDTFSDSIFLSRYQPTSDDIRCNVRDLHKSNMFTELNSPRLQKRMRSTMLTIETDVVDEDYSEYHHSELPCLEISKKSRIATATSPIEARTPLSEEALDTFDDSQPDLLLVPEPSPSSPPAAAGPESIIIPAQHTEKATLVEPDQLEQIITPETPLKHQLQVQEESGPLVPFDNPIPETRTRSKASKKLLPVAKSPLKKTEQQFNPDLLLQRLTRRQAKLIEDKGGNPEFVIPQLPEPKKRGRAVKAKSPKPNFDDPHKLETEIIQQRKQVHILKEAETKEADSIEAEIKEAEIKEAEIKETELKDAVPAKEPNQVAVEQKEVGQIVMEGLTISRDEQQLDAVVKKAEEDERIRAYRKQKSDTEIKTILESFPQLARYYELIERAGSGTFSRVYKAKDLLVNDYMPLDQKQRLASALGDNADMNYVAIKLIFDISKPIRVANEIRCLAHLRCSPGITPLITAFRHEALTFVVLPYIKFDHFDDFFRDMKADDVKRYISELLIGLKSAHKKGFMHRDVKPGNFLYNVKAKTGYLADFGLARMSSVKSSVANQNPIKNVKNSQYSQKEDGEFGYYDHDSRPSFQADRSGTKGFRAPEVMLRYRYQTSAIDMWAVGVILLTILTARYPIFEPEDDADGIMELAHVFGMKKLKEFAEFYGRAIHTNIPTIPEDPIHLVSFCREINKDRIDKWDQEEYMLAVDLTVQCLQLIHTNRISAADALKHPFFTSNKTWLH